MLTLIKSEKFKNDYENYKKVISTISNEQVQTQLNNLLNSLVREVKLLDSYHYELVNSRKLPSAYDDTRNKVQEIRKKLDKTISDWKKI